MLVDFSKIEDELILEIGKFTILWSSFENNFCKNNCNTRSIKNACSNIKMDKEKLNVLKEVINKRREISYYTIPEYVCKGLHPKNANKDSVENNNLMKKFLEQEEPLEIGCLLLIHRIRNNLLHGLKEVVELNDQLNLFKAINGVLESIKQ